MLYSCKEKAGPTVDRTGSYMTQQSENTVVINSVNGQLSYRMTAPLLERYEYASEPYTEYRRGIDVIMYNDSTGVVESTLRANYAIYMEVQDLWEAKGNVVATNAKGEKLETEQLFWNRKEKRVYSNVDSKVTQGGDVVIGDGFESDEAFEEFEVRNARGKVSVDISPNEDDAEGNDELSSDLKPQDGAPAEGVPMIREGEAVAKPAANPAGR